MTEKIRKKRENNNYYNFSLMLIKLTQPSTSVLLY